MRLASGPGGFLAAWDHLLAGVAVPRVPRRPGRPPRIPLTALLAALTFHVMQEVGTLREHLLEVWGDSLADSSWSDRRTRLPWTIFEDLMRRVLRPRATAEGQPDAFFCGWRLLALDGTDFNLLNAPTMRPARPKARTRRGPAAFAKLPIAVLLELGLHHPVAAAIGRAGESEWALAGALLAHLPAHALLLADRLYGCAAFLGPLQAACATVGSHFLVRARANVRSRVRGTYVDGSRHVALAWRAPTHWRQVTTWLEVREIRVLVARPGHRAHELRLWTTLLDPTTAPALDLARLYAQRWEQELYFREVKHHLRRTDLLQSHTVETAAQEVAAIVLASALLAEARAAATPGDVPVRRLSLARVRRIVDAFWITLAVGADLLTEAQITQLLERGHAHLRRYLTPPRRARSCHRQVRQPMTVWPRTLQPTSVNGPVTYTVV
jgi:IS4 transposase